MTNSGFEINPVPEPSLWERFTWWLHSTLWDRFSMTWHRIEITDPSSVFIDGKPMDVKKGLVVWWVLAEQTPHDMLEKVTQPMKKEKKQQVLIPNEM